MLTELQKSTLSIATGKSSMGNRLGITVVKADMTTMRQYGFQREGYAIRVNGAGFVPTGTSIGAGAGNGFQLATDPATIADYLVAMVQYMRQEAGETGCDHVHILIQTGREQEAEGVMSWTLTQPETNALLDEIAEVELTDNGHLRQLAVGDWEHDIYRDTDWV